MNQEPMLGLNGAGDRRATVGGSLPISLALVTAAGCADLVGVNGVRDDFFITSRGTVLEVSQSSIVSARWDRGNSYLVTATAGGNGSWPASVPIRWTARQPSVVTIEQDGTSGRVRAVGPGVGVLVAEVDGHVDSVKVRVLAEGDRPEVSYTTISVGGDVACGLAPGGILRCWGGHVHGALAIGGRDRAVGSGAPLTVPVAQRFVSISAGADHACAVDGGGAGWCWGYNAEAQLGDGTTARRTSPTPVTGGLAFRSITAGAAVTCGLGRDERAYCWGAWPNGIRGQPARVSDTIRFVQVSAGWDHACGVDVDGAAYCWGSNQSGELGTGPVARASAAPVRVASNQRFTSISAGMGHTCALTADLEAFCWGANYYGQLGVGSNVNANVPLPVAGGRRFIAIAAGGGHTCAVARGGAAYCWGENWRGELGDGIEPGVRSAADAASNVPRMVVDVPAGGFTSISAGSGTSCALDTRSEAWCWGYGPTGVGRSIISPGTQVFAQPRPMRVASPAAWP